MSARSGSDQRSSSTASEAVVVIRWTDVDCGDFMIPVVTPEEMRAIDAASADALDVLVERAGAAVARSAERMMGGTYGRRVVVLAGPGNNGADGRVAGRRLAAKGAHVTVFDATMRPPVMPECDLVIDAAFGTGFRGSWVAPAVRAPVLAVDIPSGVDGLTGRAGEGVLAADRTVTFAALKPGLLFPPGNDFAGKVEVADVGLDVRSARAHLVQSFDVAAWIPSRRSDMHKWRSALWIIAGSSGMLGAAHLAVRGAQRTGAGMIRLSSPGVGADPLAPTEAVRAHLPAAQWSVEALSEIDRFHCAVVGPGLGRSEGTTTSVREFVAKAPIPLVIDADGLFALAWNDRGPAAVLASRTEATVITPHDGEFALLRGGRMSSDRIVEARRLAADLKVVVLLKGSTTVIAEPGGEVLLVTAGDERLATAGTGDVLSGIIGALLAQRVPAFEAAAAGAWLHGQAARLGPERGLVAGDIPDCIPDVLARL
jgi:ADP-dependent NAD(P)H-hydrate dehydratase / NAD(P)H-hydrate epimerase